GDKLRSRRPTAHRKPCRRAADCGTIARRLRVASGTQRSLRGRSMTYCVGMVLDRGLVLMSDTRTNSGVDNISVFRKMFCWTVPGERIISIMTAGNLATTQAVISQLEERTK